MGHRKIMFPVFLFTFQLFNRGFYLVTGSGEPTYTLSEAVEKLGFGKFQMKIIWMVGFFVVSTLVLFPHHYHHHRHVIIIIIIIIIVIIIIIIIIIVVIITIITKLINASVANRALVVILLHSFRTILATFIGMPPLNSCSPALLLPSCSFDFQQVGLQYVDGRQVLWVTLYIKEKKFTI